MKNLAIIFSAFLFSVSVFAENKGFSTIRGRIVVTSGEKVVPVSGIVQVVQQTDAKSFSILAEIASGEDGSIFIQHVPAGEYIVMIQSENTYSSRYFHKNFKAYQPRAFTIKVHGDKEIENLNDLSLD